MEMIKCHQSSKPNISNCETWRNMTFASIPHGICCSIFNTAIKKKHLKDSKLMVQAKPCHASSNILSLL